MQALLYLMRYMHTVYFAKWILQESGELLHNGAIAVKDGIITALGPRSRVRDNTEERLVNLGDAMLLPGLINMHTHLEEGIVRGIGKESQETFATWSIKKNSRIRQKSTEAVASSIRLGVRELLAQGVTTVVDSSRFGISPDVLANESIRSWTILEAHPDDPYQERNEIETLFDKASSVTPPLHQLGIGPHALFSLSPAAQREIIKFTYNHGNIWAMHLAESSEELQAFSEQTGDIYFHTSRHRPWPFEKATMGSMHYAITNNLIPNNGICFHCNYANGTELSLLATKRTAIVLCPSYSHALGHKPLPLDVALNRNVLICLGTEGGVPAGCFNIFDELYMVKKTYPHLRAADLLTWATKNAAHALGVADKIGSLAVGKQADIIAVRFPHNEKHEILEELLMAEPEFALVMVFGEEVIADY